MSCLFVSEIYEMLGRLLMNGLVIVEVMLILMYDTLGDISSVNTIDIIIYYENITSTIIIPLISKPPSIP